MPSDSFPHFSFSGDARSRGLAYGRALGERIHATFALYDDRLFSRSALSRAEIIERAERVRGLVDGFNGDYVVELDGVAEGAGVARWQIYALNARTEILNANVGECTTLCFPEAGLLAQTWDWVDALEDLAILVTYELPGGGRVLTFTEPGMLAKIGFNSAGLGVCLNFLDHRHALDGVPVHILCRAILDNDSVAAARTCVERSGFGKTSHFLIADAAGEVQSIEFVGDAAFEVEAAREAFLHTNHCIARGAPENTTEPAPSTSRRLASGRRWLESTGERSLAVMARILLDESGGDLAINSPYHQSVLFPTERVGTCATFLMDLGRRQIHVSKGPGGASPFRIYAMDGSVSAAA